MKAILLLLLSLIILKANSQNNNNYSIDSFLDYLQESGYYEVIFGIKLSYGNDYAIGFCKTYVAMTSDCELVVVIYMIIRIRARADIKEIDVKPSSNSTVQDEIKKIDEMMNYIKQTYLDILLKNNNNDINEVNDKLVIFRKTLIKELYQKNKYKENDKYAEYKEKK